MGNKRRVVVTGLGCVSPLGNSVPDFWSGLREGKSGIGPITKVESSDLSSRVAGEVRNFDPSQRMDAKEAKKMDLFSQYAVYAGLEAIDDAGLSREKLEGDRTGVCLGTGQGGSNSIEDGVARLYERGPGRVPPLTAIKSLANLGAANLAIYMGATGPSQCIVTACAAGTDAIGTAYRWIADGHADLVFAGGSEASITRLGIASFVMIQALSTKRNDEPAKASRPFEADRDGFVMAEGAGILVLEEYEAALARGARIYCEVVGFANTCDAHHLTAPDPEGKGVAKAIGLALKDAGLEKEEVDYVSAHGTATPMNDPIETKALKHAFGEHARKLKISSIKSMIGHAMGAAGALESVAIVKTIEEGFIPPTINLENPDPECDLDYVPNKGIEWPVKVAIKESMGFGGQNAVVVFKKI
jgi:3-oxoacyl-[acyl-carrier-protein] synthase II